MVFNLTILEWGENSMATYTLWNTLQQYKVIIPIIQRDYAQGRKDDRQIEQIRKGFIKNLFDHLVSSVPLELDFIYGALHQDELELLDGQQRLTTLFLLHWYLANRTEEKLQKIEIKKNLSQFTYQTRVSSRMFISELIQHGHEIQIKQVAEDNKLSSMIENEAWYLAIWKKDPTVISMLTVLDEIHSQFQALVNYSEITAIELWKALTIDKVLCFYLLPMNDFALSEELYIKMNARGVQLTEFENFKAWLQGYLEKSIDNETRKDFFNQIDREWTDYLWTLKQFSSKSKDTNKPHNLNFDEMYMQLFKSCLLCHSYVLATFKNAKTESTYDKDEKSLVSRLRKNLIITTDEYEVLLGNANSQVQIMQNIYRFFEFIKNYSGEENIQGILLNIFNSKDSSYEAQAQFAILYFYNAYINNESQFDDWFNVTKRLVNNAKNYFNAEKDLISVLDAINHLAVEISENNILDKIRSLTETSEIFKKLTTAFDKQHIEHEIEKAELIHHNAAWKSLFRKYEKHDYFYGQISFLIDYAKDEGNQNVSMDIFTKYAEISSKIFTDKFLKDEDYIFHRSLLSIGDYLVKDGSNWSFGRQVFNTVRQRNENWRKVFEDKDRRKMLKTLLNQINEGSEFESLKNIISNNISQVKDWRSYFIKEPKTIKYCQKYQIRFHNENEIYLLSSRQMNGAHAELRTYVLYSKLLKIGFDESKVQYVEVATSSENPSLIVKLKDLPILRVKFEAGSFKNDFLMQDSVINEEHGSEYAELLMRPEYAKVIDLEKELISWVEVQEVA